MRKYIAMSLLLCAAAFSACGPKGGQNSEENGTNPWQLDQFADLRIMRYEIPEWDSLTPQQHVLCYYLSQAALCGRDILWDQNYEHNLAIRHILEGIYRGYKGLITGEIEDFETQHVSNIIQRGGTILKTARCPEFRTPEGRAQAYETMRAHGIDALVVIGGDGSLSGAREFAEEFDIPIVGLPGTIDNDLYGTDLTIGYDTALNTIVSAVDKIRDTASSHERLFFVEVMGREAGFLALNGAIASGAEAAIIPEFAFEKDQLAETIENGFRKTKNSSIVLVSESESTGGAMKVAERVEKEYPQFDVRVVILGHIQRGGSPSAQDRIIASRMGVAAIEALLEGQRNVMIGIVNDDLVYVPFSKAIKKNKPIDEDLVDALRILSI